MSEATALDIATLTLGILGAVTGAVALLWNVAEFVLAGPRITVVLSEGRTDGFQAIVGPGIWGPDPSYSGLELPQRVVAIEVTNKGRSAVTIAHAGMKFSNGIIFNSTEETNYRLDAHSSHTWRLPFEHASGVVTVSRKTNMPTSSAQWRRTSRHRQRDPVQRRCRDPRLAHSFGNLPPELPPDPSNLSVLKSPPTRKPPP